MLTELMMEIVLALLMLAFVGVILYSSLHSFKNPH